jgi:hypothetical protein
LDFYSVAGKLKNAKTTETRISHLFFQLNIFQKYLAGDNMYDTHNIQGGFVQLGFIWAWRHGASTKGQIVRQYEEDE